MRHIWGKDFAGAHLMTGFAFGVLFAWGTSLLLAGVVVGSAIAVGLLVTVGALLGRKDSA